MSPPRGGSAPVPDWSMHCFGASGLAPCRGLSEPSPEGAAPSGDQILSVVEESGTPLTEAQEVTVAPSSPFQLRDGLWERGTRLLFPKRSEFWRREFAFCAPRVRCCSAGSWRGAFAADRGCFGAGALRCLWAVLPVRCRCLHPLRATVGWCGAVSGERTGRVGQGLVLGLL